MTADNPHARDVVRLARAPNPAQAHIWQQALQAAGIRCDVVGDYLDASFGDLPGLEPELWVARDDLARAEEVLRQGEEAAGEGSPEEGTT